MKIDQPRAEQVYAATIRIQDVVAVEAYKIGGVHRVWICDQVIGGAGQQVGDRSRVSSVSSDAAPDARRHDVHHDALSGIVPVAGVALEPAQAFLTDRYFDDQFIPRDLRYVPTQRVVADQLVDVSG